MRKYGVGAALLAVGLCIAGYLWLPHQTERSASVESASQQAATHATEAPDQPPIEVPTAIVQELAGLKPGLTVAEWRLAHPNDTWYKPTYDDQSPYAPAYRRELVGLYFGKACAISTGIVELPGAKSVKRKAIFYLPPPPVPLALPETTSASRLIDTCALAYLETTLVTDDSEERSVLDSHIQSALTARYGEPSNETAEVGHSLAIMRKLQVSVWKQGEAKTVIGSFDILEPPDVLFSAYSYLPTLRYETREFPDILLDPLTPYSTPNIFELAIRTAALNAELSKSMNDLYHEWRQTGSTRRVQAQNVVDVLRSWLQASSTLSSQRRAAALLAGQFVFEMFIGRANDRKVDFDGINLRKEMMSMGAEFYDGEGGLHPGHGWIKQARELEPDGPIGDAITLMSLARWGVDGQDYFAVGDKYVAQQRDPDSKAWAEYFIASAYQDLVILGQTGDQEPEMPPSMKPSKEQIDAGAAAKTEAIKHYRAVLAIDGDKASRRALLAWRTGWKLMADLPVWYPYL